MNPTAIEGHLKLVLVEWMIIMAVAWVFGRLGRNVGQPLAVGEIAAGILLGPSALGLIWPETWPVLFPPDTQQSLQLLAKIGLILLLFQVGMEFDFGHLRARSRTITAVSVMGMFAPFLCGLAVGPWLHRSVAPELPYRGARPLTALVLALVLAPAAAADPGRVTDPNRPELVRHALRITLDPPRGWLEVDDTVTIPRAAVVDGEMEFRLHGTLEVTAADPAVTLLAPTVRAGNAGDSHPGAAAQHAAPDLRRYRVAVPADGAVRLHYQGRFDFDPSDRHPGASPGLDETPGFLSPDGVFLAGGGYWYPRFNDDLITYDLEVTQPANWHVIGAGTGTSRDARGVARWESRDGLDEITLAGGPLVVYRGSAGPVETLVYLRAHDDALAAKYLQATAEYLGHYSTLIGPYPYTKFALVENRRETGYGMPSYTLIGAQVLRLPFILTSSYPHEILHNWWGNGVFVDYARGNWCEGLTSYLADHFMEAREGRGALYRRDTLQKYRSYVREGRDFPLAEFRSRHSSATAAVGYGKTLMVFHMLRARLGDPVFRQWLAQLYRDYRGRRASFADIRATLETASGEDLGRFFADHVEKPGAARLAVAISGVRETAGVFEIAGVLRQTQPGATLLLDVPIVVETVAAPLEARVRMETAETPFTLAAPARPLAIEVDPAFDVFRLLDAREIPASIGQIFGEPRVLAVLPSQASATETVAWRALVAGWKDENLAFDLTTDAELTALPADRAVWLLGRTNTLASRYFGSGRDYTLGEREFTIGREALPLAGHAFVIVRRHPAGPDGAIGWIFADGTNALPGLGRKLPHYGRYSYLGFAGDEPQNVMKGQWAAAADSPLRVDLRATAIVGGSGR